MKKIQFIRKFGNCSHEILNYDSLIDKIIFRIMSFIIMLYHGILYTGYKIVKFNNFTPY